MALPATLTQPAFQLTVCPQHSEQLITPSPPTSTGATHFLLIFAFQSLRQFLKGKVPGGGFFRLQKSPLTEDQRAVAGPRAPPVSFLWGDDTAWG